MKKKILIIESNFIYRTSSFLCSIEKHSNFIFSVCFLLRCYIKKIYIGEQKKNKKATFTRKYQMKKQIVI